MALMTTAGQQTLVLQPNTEKGGSPVDGVHDRLQQTTALELVGGNFPRINAIETVLDTVGVYISWKGGDT